MTQHFFRRGGLLIWEVTRSEVAARFGSYRKHCKGAIGDRATYTFTMEELYCNLFDSTVADNTERGRQLDDVYASLESCCRRWKPGTQFKDSLGRANTLAHKNRRSTIKRRFVRFGSMR